jgi:type IV secretory pathway TraG/TraD family ATPase VirD4
MYFRLYKIIYFGGYCALALLAAVAIYQIVKRTKKTVERALLLSQAGPDQTAIRVGQTTDGVELYLSEKVRCGHVQILGSTGRGKTESVIVPWMARDILAHRKAFLLDGKGDPDILEKILRAANQSGNCQVHVFDLGNPDLSCAINPLENGSAQQITDRIFTAFRFEDPYYKSVQADITGTAVQLIKDLGEKVSFRRIYALLTDDGELGQAAARSSNVELKQKVTRHLSTPRFRVK